MEKHHMGCHSRTGRKKKTGPNMGVVMSHDLYGNCSGFALESCSPPPSPRLLHLHYQMDGQELESGLRAMGTHPAPSYLLLQSSF